MAPKPMKPHDARCDAEREKSRADGRELRTQARNRALLHIDEYILKIELYAKALQNLEICLGQARP